MTKPQPKVLPYGDHAVLVQYAADGFDARVSESVQALAAALRPQALWREVVPGYDSLVAVFDLAALSFDDAKRRIEDIIIREAHTPAVDAGALIEIPVNYGGDFGPDLGVICKSSGLSEKEVIARHSEHPYRVCLMGFIPGFAFLSEAPKALHHTRRATPRALVPAGSIGIAGWQTGIYGLDSPGGWQIIGRTRAKMFDPAREQPFLVTAGDRVKFVPL